MFNIGLEFFRTFQIVTQVRVYANKVLTGICVASTGSSGAGTIFYNERPLNEK